MFQLDQPARPFAYEAQKTSSAIRIGGSHARIEGFLIIPIGTVWATAHHPGTMC